MIAITHAEIRRHPRWREELQTPHRTPVLPGSPARRGRLVAIGLVLLVAACAAWWIGAGH